MSSVGYYTVFSSSARAYIIAPQSVASFCGRAADRITEKREHVIAAVTPGTFSKIIIIRTDLDTHILTALHRTCKVVGQLIAERIAHQQYAAESRICAFGIEKSGRLALLTDKLTPLKRSVHPVIIPLRESPESDIDRVSRYPVVVDRLTAENNRSRH